MVLKTYNPQQVFIFIGKEKYLLDDLTSASEDNLINKEYEKLQKNIETQLYSKLQIPNSMLPAQHGQHSTMDDLEQSLRELRAKMDAVPIVVKVDAPSTISRLFVETLRTMFGVETHVDNSLPKNTIRRTWSDGREELVRLDEASIPRLRTDLIGL